MRILGLVSLLALAASPALADSPWSFGGSVGYDIPVDGKVLAAGNSAPQNLNNFNSTLTGTGILRLRGTDYSDAYDPALRATLEVRYAMSDSTEFFGAFTYTKAEGKTGSIGCIDIAGDCTTDLIGRFADYQQYGAEIGYRQWLYSSLLGENVHPYFAVRAGVAKTDKIHAYLATPTAGIAHWRLYDDELVYTFGADFGATYTISPNAEIGGEIGLRYQSDLKDVDLDFGAIGLGTTNDKSTRFSVPISVRLNAAF